MTWPFETPKNTPSVEAGDGKDKPPEKTPAEVIAESLGPLLKPIQDKLDAYETRFNTLESQTKPREPKTTSEPSEGPVSVLDDENVAFAQRLTPLMARQLELEARIVKNDIKSEYIRDGYGDLWGKYATEIDTMIDNSPLVQNDVNGQVKTLRGDPQYIRNVVDLIFGRAARKAGMRFDGKDKGFFLESASGSSEHTSDTPVDGMTDAQRKVATRMGVPLDKAKDVLKKLQFVS